MGAGKGSTQVTKLFSKSGFICTGYEWDFGPVYDRFRNARGIGAQELAEGDRVITRGDLHYFSAKGKAIGGPSWGNGPIAERLLRRAHALRLIRDIGSYVED